MDGTDNMETMMRMSALQPMSHDTISILDRAGSRGNSTMSRPVGVREPETETRRNLPQIHAKGIRKLLFQKC